MKPVALIVFAKAPQPGLAKTRLAPALGLAGAAALAERLLRHALQQALDAALGPVLLCVSPDGNHPALVELARRAGVTLTLQGDGDLGQRMDRALQRQLLQHPAALLMGTDAPALDAKLLHSAAAALAEHDAVFAPTFDGGYVLVGLKRAAPSLFADMRWSHPGVMADTRQRLAAAGLRHHELPWLHDIDEPADLVHLPPAWREGEAT